MNSAVSRPPCRLRRGLSHVEVVVSTMLVGVVLVGATNLLGGVVRSRTASSHKARGVHFAQQMLTEIASGIYIDDGILPVFGPELLEALGNRTNFDDVDDYHGWTESPLRDRTGSVIANTTGWRRTVTVAWVNPATPSTTVGSDQGVKRVTITVQNNGQTVARLVSLRTDQ